ncbi:nucleoside hydrolase [Kiritimatiellaeota bacterium B1221]|nr:nucleoside hydrolase [Kiritimatiellaeota bacterium B1221]
MIPTSFSPPSPRPVKILLDTDMATDCDDVGAIAVLHRLASLGEAEILGVVANNYDPASIAVVAALNSFYGRPGIPLGACQADEVGHPAAEFMREIAADTQSYGHHITHRNQVPGAVELYRRQLATAPDQSAVIVSIGHLNNLADLLQSPPDEFSPLTGSELVEKKVPHLIIMGGDYPSGKEHNFWARGAIPYTQTVMDLWPTPMLFSGFTLGQKIVTGPGLVTLPLHHPLHRAYAGHACRPLEKGRPSWDQSAILAAVRGVEPYWNLSEPGHNRIDTDGSNFWEPDPKASHRYLIENMPPENVADEITQLMKTNS